MTLERGALTSLEALLDDVDDVRWPSDQLYIEGPRESWEDATQCAIVEVDPYEEEPEEVVVEGARLRRALAGFQVSEIMHHLRLGAPPSPSDFVAGLKHFHEFDSFLSNE